MESPSAAVFGPPGGFCVCWNVWAFVLLCGAFCKKVYFLAKQAGKKFYFKKNNKSGEYLLKIYVFYDIVFFEPKIQ